MTTAAAPGPLRRAGLYLGLVSDDQQPAMAYARGELTWFQVKMMVAYAVAAAALWVVYAVTGRWTALEVAAFWSALVVWMCAVGVRRARTAPPPENVGGPS